MRASSPKTTTGVAGITCTRTILKRRRLEPLTKLLRLIPAWADLAEAIQREGMGRTLRRMLAFLGPAFLVSVGYMDPGNWATDLEGGARFSYTLLWVLLLSNLIAILLQSLSAKLGITTGKDLAQL